MVPEGPPERVPLPEGVEPESPVLWVDCGTPVAEEPLPVCGIEPVADPLEPLEGVSDPCAVPDDWEALEAVSDPPVDALEDGYSPEFVVWP